MPVMPLVAMIVVVMVMRRSLSRWCHSSQSCSLAAVNIFRMKLSVHCVRLLTQLYDFYIMLTDGFPKWRFFMPLSSGIMESLLGCHKILLHPLARQQLMPANE
jgi:hypothetical protein